MVRKTIEIMDLKTYFYTRRGLVKAVDGVNFAVAKGETLGLVGESGSGKSITCLSILKLVPQPAGHIVGGKILLNGEDLIPKSEKEMRQIRGSKISMILQEPMTSLNPVFTIADQVGEPIRLHQKLNKKSVLNKVKEMLTLVKIPSPEIRMKSYPHQMSGGMRQRIMGAMMLSCQPDLLIADEPTTALDVTIQAQFLKLIKDIQRDFKLSMIIVTHDFGIVAKACDRVAVMYAGRIVENAPIMEIFDNPQHPYTRALMNSLPKMEQKVHRLYSIAGQPPDLADLPRGCSFSPRCPDPKEICFQKSPPRSEATDGHFVSCWLNDSQTS
jgi:peptide/nickel transport system ATP-binding protein/oligopeptide transport system ATP-binding protein